MALVQELRSQDAAAPSAVIAQLEVPPVQPVMDDTEPATVYTTPPATESAAGIAPAELANFLVAHYGYATPLVRRSVGAGLIGDDSSALQEGVPPAEQDGQ